MTTCSQSAKPVATARWIRTASGEWPTGSHSGKLDFMHATVPTYSLYGIEALPADVVVKSGGVRVVEPGPGGSWLSSKRAC
jgi:hypothetical protein